jgi:hypothetical protein
MVINIRLKDNEDNLDFVNKLKSFTHEQAISKAFVSASTKYLFLTSELANEKAKREKAEEEVRRLSYVLSDLDNACRATLEITGQGDLLK